MRSGTGKGEEERRERDQEVLPDRGRVPGSKGTETGAWGEQSVWLLKEEDF